ncbi:hypothetical protein [Flavobacterium psychrotrophum]|uniref:hypothetical protein n=1 Tax=Flavobacterium psychrotrophum TaxID=2294119 RepID=UPI000E3199BE|nr:hypothetical protein [Flavobacterium psychrotrophum]
MFTTGQIIFAIAFIIVFATVLVFMYRKDLPLHKKYYKNSYLILLCFLLFIALLFVIKFLTKDTTN